MVTHDASGNDSYHLDHGLERDPFPLAADDILFQTPESTALLQTLRELIAGNQKTVLVTGPAESGKSTLAEYLENHPEENWHIQLIQIENDMDRQALAWRMVQLALPEKAPKPAMAIPMLHKYLELSSHAGFVPVFVLDDADRLTADTLQFVLELATLRYAESLYRFVLFAGPAITKKLAEPSLQELVTSGLEILTLPSFSRNQTREYIELRMKAAGDDGRFSFDDKKIDAIHRITGGLPGPINTAARKAMQAVVTAADPGGEEHRDDPTPVSQPARGRRVLVAATIAVIAVAGLAGWLYSGTDSGSEVEDQVVFESADESADIDENNESSGVANPAPDNLPPSDSTELPVTEDTAQAVIESPAVEPAQEQPVADPGTAIDPATVDVTGAIIAETSPDTGTDTAPEPSVEVPATPVADVEPPVEVTNPVEVKDTPAIASRPYTIDGANIYNLESVPALLTGMRGNSWFRLQSRTAYTLQLISASNIDNVIELIESAPATRPELSGYVKYTPSGKPRFLMFYGLYPDKDSAAAAVTTLPASLQAVNPWPRSIGNITDEIDTVIGTGRP